MAAVMVVVPELANTYGLHEALVLRQLHYWLGRATCFHDGKPEIYKSISEWSEEFTWWSRSTVHKLLTSLANDDLIRIRSANGRTYYTILYENLHKQCREALLMLSEIRTDDAPEQREQPSDIRTEGGKDSVMLSENRTEVSEFRTANNKEVTEITSEITQREREKRPHAPHLLPSGMNGAKSVRVSSPHLDPRHFVNGFVPPGKGTSAVEVYYERFGINADGERLSPLQEDDLIRNCPDLGLLREVIVAYEQSPHRRRNIKLILDWYREPSRFRKEHHGTHNGRNGTHYERPPDADFTQQQWDDWLGSQPKEEIPY